MESPIVAVRLYLAEKIGGSPVNENTPPTPAVNASTLIKAELITVAVEVW
jgi:hypothetical protein